MKSIITYFLRYFLLCFLSNFLFIASTMGTVSVPDLECPIQFEGKISRILESEIQHHSFNTTSIIFKDIALLKGEVEENIPVKVLKNGPFELKEGEEYRVHLRQGKVCLIEKL